MSNSGLEIFIDGACSGNPGPAGVGVVINQNGQCVKEVSKAIGHATNNIAEYTACIYALQEALILKADKIKIFTDSELLFKQVSGQYKVKNPKLKTLFDQIKTLVQGFASFEIQHVPREKNKDADRLASGSLRKKQTEMVSPMLDCVGEESPSSKG